MAVPIQSAIEQCNDRPGRRQQVVCNSITTGLTYNDANQLLTEGYSGGILGGLSVNNTYTSYLQRYTVTALNGGTTLQGATYAYDTAGRLQTVTDSPYVASYANQVTNVVLYAYEAAGRKTNEVCQGVATNRFAFSAAGDLLTLTDGNSNATGWGYDLYGRVTNKVDATGTTILKYQYDAGNRLTNRWSLAKTNTSYAYDAAGNLTSVTYPNNHAVTLSYDAENHLTNLVDGLGTTSYSYDAMGRLLSEGGLWPNDVVSYGYTAGLRTRLGVQNPDGTAWSQSYGYDGAKRLTNVVSPAGTFSYRYNGAGTLVTNLALPNGGAITNGYDNVGRLTGTYLLTRAGSVLNSHAYLYNKAGQRTQQTRTDGSYVTYGYDGMGQLISAAGKESGGVTNRMNEQFGYTYDPAGNLHYRTMNVLTQAFAVNTLNELTNITRSGTLTVAGTTTSAATNVAVNGSAAILYRDATFGATGFSLADGTNTFTAIAADSLARKNTNAVSVFLPASASPTYDGNGNLTYDGLRAFVYDDENQLVQVTVTNSYRVQFAYDGKLRRRVRTEFVWQSGAWVTNQVVRYVCDGMLVVQERDANNVPLVGYTRGRDLSGGLSGAGGIGGLLARTDYQTLLNYQPTTAFYHADGNGNVTALMNVQGRWRRSTSMIRSARRWRKPVQWQTRTSTGSVPRNGMRTLVSITTDFGSMIRICSGG